MAPLSFHFWLNFTFLMFPTKMSEKSVKILQKFLLEKKKTFSTALHSSSVIYLKHHMGKNPGV